MSLQIPIQKDIGEYEEKIIGKMSLRTLICVAGGFGCAVIVACIIFFGFGIEIGKATLPVMAAALPFWLAGFWRPYGMKLEECLPLLYRHLQEKPLVYESWATSISSLNNYPTPGKTTRKARKRARKKGAELHGPSKQAKSLESTK